LPENARKLRGLVWRGDESNLRMTFSTEENEDNEKLAKATKAAVAKEAVPMKIRKETLNYDKKKTKNSAVAVLSFLNRNKN
jgi:hypothetical protein